MNINDQIIASCRIGNQKQDTENIGKVISVEIVQDPEHFYQIVCEFKNGQVLTLPQNKVFKFFSISDARLLACCKQQLNVVVETIKIACDKLIDSEIIGKVDINRQEATISMCGGDLVLEPAAYRVRTLRQVREKAGFALSVMRYSVSRTESPDVDKVLVKVAIGDMEIARMVVDTLFSVRADQVFENICCERIIQGLTG